MNQKEFKIPVSEIKQLIPAMGGAIATDKIVVEGLPIGFMYRETGINDMDNGWRFFSGTEDEEYISNNSNSRVYNVNTIVNYDPAIVPYLELPAYIELERAENSDIFNIISG